MSNWFTELEEAAYSVVEYIPLVGTVYSLKRAMISYSRRDWTRHWQSVGNFVESSVRDVVLFGELAEPTKVVLLHTMAESFTDKMIELYHRETTERHCIHRYPHTPQIRPERREDPARSSARIVRRGTFSWRWTEDDAGIKNRPEATLGYIRLVAGTPTRFELSKRKGAGGWAGYDFWGQINSKDRITATTKEGIDIQIDFTRVSGT